MQRLVPISLGQVFVMCVGAVAMLFMGYELIERFWLTELDSSVAHGLHLLLGLAGAGLAGSLATFVLLCQVDACDPGTVPSRRLRGWVGWVQGVSLRTKLIVPIVLLAVLPGVGIGYLTIGQFDRELADAAQRSLEVAAGRVVSAIDAIMEAGLADAATIASNPSLVEVGSGAAVGGGVLAQAERDVGAFLMDHAGHARVRVVAPGEQELLRVERTGTAGVSAQGLSASVAAPGWAGLASERLGTLQAGSGFVVATPGVNFASDVAAVGSLHYVWPISGGDSVVAAVVLDASAFVLSPLLTVFAPDGLSTLQDATGATLIAAGPSAAEDVDVERHLVATAPLVGGGLDGSVSLAVIRGPPAGIASQLGAFISLVLFLALAVAMITGVLVAHYVTRPLKRLRTATLAIASGDLERRVEVSTGDEIEGLALDFNHMAERLSVASHRLSHWNEELLQEVDKQTSALSQLQAGLARTDRLSCMGQMAASVMHEVGNPLAAIKTKIQVAEERGDLDEPGTRVLDDIVLEIDRLSGVLRSFSRLSRLRQPEFKPVSLSEVVSGVASLVGSQVRKKGIALQVVDKEDVGLIQADADQLRQLIINLVLNAVDAVYSGGEIRIEARAASANDSGEEGVSLVVIDNGAGIPEPNLEQIWDPFFTTKDDGTGLGLAVSRQIVEEHGGVLTIESKEGEGTTVTATFPPAAGHRELMTATAGPGQ